MIRPLLVLLPLVALAGCSDAFARPTVIGNTILTDGGIQLGYTDLSGTPGNGTCNKWACRAAIAAGASAATITDTMIAATCIVPIVPESADATLGTLIGVPGAGSIVVTNRTGGVATNVTAATTFSFIVNCVF